jgi:hypothetical protein
MHKHAQEEIRSYNVIGSEIVSRWVPIVWETFVDINAIAAGDRKRALSLAHQFGMLVLLMVIWYRIEIDASLTKKLGVIGLQFDAPA